jgi:O-antigen/teichoic acid export membrane protein
MTADRLTDYAPAPEHVARLKARVLHEASPRGRLGQVALLLASLSMSSVIVALWVTEPALPPRTQGAFAVLTFIGLSWAVYAVWTLSARRVLLARQRVVATTMSVAYTTVFTVGAAVIWLGAGIAAAGWAVAAGLVMLAVALALWIRARAGAARLAQRCADLAG